MTQKMLDMNGKPIINFVHAGDIIMEGSVVDFKQMFPGFLPEYRNMLSNEGNIFNEANCLV